MNGIIKKYEFDDDYFKIGCCFQIEISCNVYRNAILISKDSEKLKFTYLNKENDKMIDFEITLDELLDYDWNKDKLIKLIPDYKKGMFKNND